MTRAERAAVGGAIGFGAVMAPGMILAAFAVLYALPVALVGAGIGALIGYFTR